MGPQEKITIREREDLGPVLARADHQDNAIEVNAKAFYSLPPMVQEFVMCHEVCHLKHNEWDEQRTNRLAADLFLKRSKGAEDRNEREQFLSYLDGDESQYSNFGFWQALLSVAPALYNLGTTIFGIYKTQNAYWYSWDDKTKRSNLQTMLNTAFEESRRSSKRSAADFFWSQMQHYTNKDDSLTEFLARSENAWVKVYIVKYENSYGFGFEEVTPIDLTAYPLVIVAIGAVVGYVVYKIIKNRKK